MKGIYASVQWFQELAKEVVDGTPEQLATRAKKVEWREGRKRGQLLNYRRENIDPFSFFYSICRNCDGPENTERVVDSISQEFNLQTQHPVRPRDVFYFPDKDKSNVLFHANGEGDPEQLWRLFCQAVKGVDDVKGEDFERALKVRDAKGEIDIGKLTRTLSLINPKEFLPYDESTRQFIDVSATPDWRSYGQALDKLRGAFPGCALYEINRFAQLTRCKKLKPSSKCFQVSTDIFDDGTDYWGEFESNSWVRAPGLAYNSPFGEDLRDGAKPYPLEKPKQGDIVLVYGGGEGKAIGIVWCNDYETNLTAGSKVHVIWLNKSQVSLKGKSYGRHWFSQAPKMESTFRQIDAYKPTFTLLGINDDDIGKAVPMQGQPLNQILYGPPGTGKTFATFKRCVEICDGEAPNDEIEIRERYRELVEVGQVEFVTFHQSYGYEEFVEGLRPVSSQDGPSIKVKKGLIRRIAKRARKSDQPHVLVIDEINRANISKVMGELITLIEADKRKGQDNEVRVRLPHSQKSFSLPSNLYILGTMNTADRSIALLDVALRRRFDFEEMLPEPDLLQDEKEKTGVDLPKVLNTINESLEYLIDRDHLIGHAWLMGIQSKDELDECMRQKIIPLIAEYFFEDWSKVHAVLGSGDGFLDKEKLESPKGLSDDRYRWRLRKKFKPSVYDELIGQPK